MGERASAAAFGKRKLFFMMRQPFNNKGSNVACGYHFMMHKPPCGCDKLGKVSMTAGVNTNFDPSLDKEAELQSDIEVLG